MIDLDRLDFAKGGGLVTVVAQDATTGAVLMVAHADREALEKTLATGEMHYHSRSRGLWRKGATSGNTQRVVSLAADCDGDAVLARVIPAGPACHTGQVSCFGEEALAADALGELERTIARRVAEGEEAAHRGASEPGTASRQRAQAVVSRPESVTAPPEDRGPAPPARPSYTRRLLADRNLRLKKLGEEAAELAVALADGDRERAAEEGADLLYHTLVALAPAGLTLADVRRVLAARASAAPRAASSRDDPAPRASAGRSDDQGKKQ